ncbi:hypothetical protein D0T84_16475 [Dysgonomonas sp. 521]|uniref:metallophosphoesterase n=1 Tax=Dysgonomonas sp. 521 TaxID=2302932 RepID=UPI0013D88BEE|nr:metallophosphoesterase [Dysgonomonas sp. 521]NDV96497.1 hypothetical protein [Dysgonomonas sp. 521]
MKNVKYPFYVIFLLVILSACSSSDDPTEPTAPEKGIYPRFAVISDIHVGRPDSKDKVIRALKNIQEQNPSPDAIFVVGDITDYSKESQYNGLIQLFNQNVASDIPVYYMLGNHDVGSIDGDPLTLYMNKLGQPLHQYIEIKGFPFISVSLTNMSATYGQEEKDFLSAALEDASKKYPSHPIFLFAHIGVLNTVYGTRFSDGWGVDSFASILKNYPQVIIFSGHSHFPIGDPRSIHQQDFTSVNVGSTAYSEIEPGFTEGIHPPGNEEVTEGIMATVDENMNVTLERLDTYRGQEIFPRWVVKAPHNGTMFTYANRDGGSSPAFDANAKPTVSNITMNSCTISFPQAADDEVVHHYKVEILKNGQGYKSMTIFSQFYLNSDMPDSLSANFTELEAGTKYSVQVIAIDSYNNQSVAITTPEFTTKTN